MLTLSADAAIAPQRFETAAALRLWLSEQFAHESDPVVILRTVAESVGSFLGAGRVGYGEVVPGEDWITIPIDWTDGIPSMVGRHPLFRHSTIVRSYEQGRTMVVPDINALAIPRKERELMRETHCRSFVSVPLIHDGEFVALFSITCPDVREWTEEEVALIAHCGARTWSALQHARAITRLSESEEQFRTLAESLPGLCWISDPTGMAIWINRQGDEYFDGMMTSVADTGNVVHPDDVALALGKWEEALATGRPLEMVVRLHDAAGIYRPFLSRAQPILDENGRVLRWCVTHIDISEREVHDRRQALLRALADRTRDLSDADTILAIGGRMLAEHLGIMRVAIAEPTGEDAALFRVSRMGRGDPIDTPVTLSRYGEGYEPLIAMLGRGETLVVDDVEATASPLTAPVLADVLEVGVRSGIQVPLLRDGRLAAVVAAQDDHPRRWTADEIELCEEVAERLWAIVTRARAEAQLAQREEQFRTLAENTPALCWLAGPDGRAYWGNRQWNDFFAGTDAMSGDPRTIIHPDDVERVTQAWQVSREHGTAVELTVTMRGRDDVYRPFLASTVPIHDASGAVARWCGVLVDLSEKHDRDRRDAFVRDLNERIRDEADAEAILRTTADALRRYLDVARVMHGEFGDGGSLHTIHSDAPDYHPVPALVHYRFPPAMASMMAALGRGETLVVNDLTRPSQVVNTGVREYFTGLGIRSGAIVPVVEDGKLVALLGLHHTSPRTWTAQEVKLAEEIAERGWNAVTRARAEAGLLERERQQAFLLEWSDRVRRHADTDAILSLTVEYLGTYLRAGRATYTEGAGEPRIVTVLQEWNEGLPPIRGVRFPLARMGQGIEQEFLDSSFLISHDVTQDPRVDEAARAFFAQMGTRSILAVPLSRGDGVPAALSVQSSTPRRWRDDEIDLVRELADRTTVIVERARAETSLVERQKHQAFAIEWNDRVRAEPSADTILAETLARLGAHLGASRATYAQSEADQGFVITQEWCAGDAASMVGTQLSVDSIGPVIDAAVRRGETIVCTDAARDDRLTALVRQRYATTGTRAFLSVPLIRDGRVVAVMSIQQTRPRDWRQAELQLVRDIADRVWTMVERVRAEAELKARERHQAFLLAWSDRLRGETSPDTILWITLEQLAQHVGTARANYAELASDGTRLDILQEWRRDSVPVDHETTARDAVSLGVHDHYRDGAPVVIGDVHGDPRFDPAACAAYEAVEAVAFVGMPMIRGGKVRAVLSVQQSTPRRWQPSEIHLLQDVADRLWVVLERARAEEALQERERSQAFLIAWGDSIRNESDPHLIVARTLDSLGRFLAGSRVSYSETAPSGDALRIVQTWENGAEVHPLAGPIPFAVLGRSVIAEHLTGQAYVVADVAADPRLDAVASRYQAAGVRAFLNAPMVRDRQLAAVLSVHQATARRWTESEVRLVHEVADRTWSTLERARFGQRLAESEALLSTFMDNAPIGMHLKDAGGRYIRINPEQAIATGSTMEELIGRHPDEIFPPDVAAVIEEIEAQARGGQLASAEFHGGTSERYRSVLSIVFPIPGEGRARTAGFTIDQTERKQAEAALQRSREALYQTEKLTALGSLLAGVSHELNNPLSIVVAQAVMMERKAGGTELADRAVKIRRAADRCAKIVQTFLAMARQKEPERSAVDLNAVVTAALDLTEYGLRTEGVASRTLLADDLPSIAADADQLHQIVINLLINAQQAMAAAGTPSPAITIATARGPEPQTVMLEVADNGPGVPEDARRRIFEPFYTTKPQGEGTGVGLSFSQGLAEAHGGRLALIPTDGGATFRLTLPIDQKVTLARTLTELEAAPDLPPRRALVIDDEQEIAESLADFLSIEGFECELAIGGAAGKARLASGQFDLIVSDLRMPEVDGPALHAWLVEQRPDLVHRIAFTTGDTLGAAAARFLETTDRPVLEKPFMPEAVHRLLEQMELS